MALSENYRSETIGRRDCRPIVRLSADTIVQWDYRPNPNSMCVVSDFCTLLCCFGVTINEWMNEWIVAVVAVTNTMIQDMKTTNLQNTWRQSRSTTPTPGSMSSKQIGQLNGSVLRTRGWSWTSRICCRFSSRCVSSSCRASCQSTPPSTVYWEKRQPIKTRLVK